MTIVARFPLVAATCVMVALGLAGPFARAQTAVDFAALLAEAGVDVGALGPLAEADELAADQVAAIDQTLFRLGELERGQFGAAVRDAAESIAGMPEEALLNLQSGALVQLDGTVVQRSDFRLPEGAGGQLLRYDVELDDGGAAVVISSHVPRWWSDRDALQERLSAVGVFVGTTSGEDRPRAVVLVNRFRWFPTSGVPSGVAWLAANGFDAALLDDVRPASAFGKSSESRESEAFYAALAAVGRGNAGELLRLAGQEVHDAVDRWRDRAAAPPVEADDAKLNARIAAAVARSAERGVSSVGPLYLAAADTMGRLVLLEGVARRAVRIAVDDDSAPDDLAEYYELDLFTPDSENLPVICAVTRLPPGFPTGDRIHEPVRVAGVFLKRWAYLARPDADDGEAARRLAAPLVLAAPPQWLQAADGAAARGRQLWWGLAFVAALAAVWFVAARAARRDRLARLRRRGYDAESGVDLGPPPAEQ